jgi:hypothetical protein
MSDGFRAHPDGIGAAAKKAHEHADRVEAHSRNLDARTRGRSLGKGPLGRVVEKSVRPIIDSMINDMGRAMAKGHRSLGQGLEITRKNLDDAEKAVHKGLRESGSSLDRHGVELRPGQSVPDRGGLRELYRRRMGERVAELELQGHGVGRHLKVTDQQLKDRLGTPIKESYKVDAPTVLNSHGYPIKQPKVTRVRLARDRYGFPTADKKIDPLRGPGARFRYKEPELYHDVEKKDQLGNPINHSCERYSTAFTDEESFVYAENFARSRVDPSINDRQTIEFHPHEAWGPGGHVGRFRGYSIDPATPMNRDGTINYRDVDFRGARIKAVYDPDGNGGFKLHTMFPVPNMGRNRHGVR